MKNSKPNTLLTKVITSQHCIEVNGIQIELIYMFSLSTLQIFWEDKLIINTQFRPGYMAVNYNNLIEVAARVYSDHYERLCP